MVSVVICAYDTNRWELLRRAVGSVESQAVAAEILIVIDHNDELLNLSKKEWPHHLVVANRHSKGLSGARNTGVSESTRPIVAFLDDDAAADSGWLAGLASGFDGAEVGGVGGRVLPVWTSPAPGWFPPEFLWVVGCSYLGQPTTVAQIRNPIGANMAFRTAVFERTGGFREEVGRIGALPLGCEETELSIRARRSGFSIWYRPDAIVRHVVPAERTTLRYLLRRSMAEGMSKAVVSAMAGREDGLSSERAYVRRTLPSGVRRGLTQGMLGPRRGDGFGQAAAIVGGVVAATIGYVRGTVAHKRDRVQLQDAPALQFTRPRHA